MDYEDVSLFLNKTIKMCTNFDDNGGRRIYTGKIKSMNKEANTLIILDRYEQLNLVRLDDITFISEVRENGGNLT